MGSESILVHNAREAAYKAIIMDVVYKIRPLCNTYKNERLKVKNPLLQIWKLRNYIFLNFVRASFRFKIYVKKYNDPLCLFFGDSVFKILYLPKTDYQNIIICHVGFDAHPNVICKISQHSKIFTF